MCAVVHYVFFFNLREKRRKDEDENIYLQYQEADFIELYAWKYNFPYVSKSSMNENVYMHELYLQA